MIVQSVIIKETNSDFGSDFPLWDRIFGTYKVQPEDCKFVMATIKLNTLQIQIVGFKAKQSSKRKERKAL